MMAPQQNGTAPADTGGALQQFWTDYGADIETLGLFGGGILVYALIVNLFYQIISKRVMFGTVAADGKARVGGPGRGFVYLMMFPLVSFLFFVLLSAAILFLGSQEQAPITVFTIAMAIVLAVRVAAYFSEATSHDVAKMLPLGLLGVVLVQARVLDLAESVRRLLEIFEYVDVILVYFGIVVVAEYVLRTIYLIVGASKSSKQRRRGQTPAAAPGPKR